MKLKRLKMNSEEKMLSFWGHLDILRTAIVKTIAVWGVFSIISFTFKEDLFNLILAPKSSDFITYKWINEICGFFGIEGLDIPDIHLINTGLAQQFIIHMKSSLCMGVILAAPFVLYLLFKFVSPGLYTYEKKYTRQVLINGYIMFMLGVFMSYFILFPITFQFLSTYQVAHDVVNMISLESYISTLIIMCLCIGIVFELPVLAWLFAKIGVISSNFMSKYRKHAIIVILIIAAIITPTSDIFTLMLVSFPIYLLYEASILIVRQVRIDQ